MKRTSYPKVKDDEGAKQLACAIILEAVKLYCGKKTTPQTKGKILKNLRKNHLINGLTDDLGIHTAEQLELHEDEIADRLGLCEDEEDQAEELIIMEQGQIISVDGNLYKYVEFDETIQMHKVAVVEIDEEGTLTATHSIWYFTTRQLENSEVQFTKPQWYGIVEFFIRQEYPHLTEEDVETATEDIVGREFAYGRPKTIEELRKHIAAHVNR